MRIDLIELKLNCVCVCVFVVEDKAAKTELYMYWIDSSLSLFRLLIKFYTQMWNEPLMWSLVYLSAPTSDM